MPPRRRRERIGEIRCHQYRPPDAAKLRCSSTWTNAVVERRVVHGRDVPEPHRPDVGDDAERRAGRRSPSRSSIASTCLRDRPQQLLRQAEDEQDRDEVGEQQVLDHVAGGELLADPVHRRDERDEDQQRARPSTATSRPTPGARPCASARRRRTRRRATVSRTAGAIVHEVSTFVGDDVATQSARSRLVRSRGRPGSVARACWSELRRDRRPAGLRGVPGAARRRGTRSSAPGCLRDLPWLGDRRLPPLRAASPRRPRLPRGGRAVRHRVGAGRLRAARRSRSCAR